ncbi:MULTISPECIES: hypothetical protein [Terrabacteria group]|uniref:hypothetical protein n=1 Tax=Bacillati TaxID=1783272 RepID=UPI001C6E68ED|nr:MULTISPECIES: hypothetical protein [Terrabacteria group]MBW9213093.1 hypothetical protein [Trueperella sp. zg.1013]
MAKQTKSPIAGRNIYLNKHNQKILFDSFSKTGYLIRDEEAQRFTLYQNRWVLALAIGILVYSFLKQIPVSILIGLAYGLFQEYRYRRVWLPGLTQFPNFKPEKKVGFIEGLIQQNKAWECFLLGLAFMAFGVLLVIKGILEKDAPILLAFEILVMIATTYKAIQYFFALYQIKKKR